jgi:3-oxoacyl-[acyl-carrier protein] reductase
MAKNLTGKVALVTGRSCGIGAAMVMGEGGRIISIGSTGGRRVPFTGIADYAATKATVVAYTKGWARDLGPKGISVNTVQSGPIDTDMNPYNSDFAAVLKASTALGRYGRPEEVAVAVTFLTSPDASYITGTTLDVDGGQSAWLLSHTCTAGAELWTINQ